MQRYEYKLVPAPEKALKHKGMKGAAVFAATLEDVMNALGAEGWSYLRADTLPEEVRTGLTSKTTIYRNILIFQRALPQHLSDPAPAHQSDPAPAHPPRRRLPPPEEIADDDDDAPPALINLFADSDDLPTDPATAPETGPATPRRP